MVENKNSPKRRVYRSVDEFDERFFPNYHESRLSQKRREEPSSFGTGLAKELLDDIRSRLSK